MTKLAPPSLKEEVPATKDSIFQMASRERQQYKSPSDTAISWVEVILQRPNDQKNDQQHRDTAVERGKLGLVWSRCIRNDKIKTEKMMSDPGCYSPHFSSFRSAITITHAQKPLFFTQCLMDLIHSLP